MTTGHTAQSDKTGASARRRPPVGLRAKDLAAHAIVFRGDRNLGVEPFELTDAGDDDLVVDICWSGVSTGTERLLWTGEMPTFPGFSYPLVPGYEAVGRVIACNAARRYIGRTVFVPGANCYKGARGLFGASASRIVVPIRRAVLIEGLPRIESTLLALAATAYHAVAIGGLPDLIVGHGTLGRLLARTAMAMGAPAPTVWETNTDRRDEQAYPVLDPNDDPRTDYARICDVSGDVGALDTMIGRSTRGGIITLAGFYSSRPSFAFPPAFMKEVSLRIAAEWTPADLAGVLDLVGRGKLKLDGLITHTSPAAEAPGAYRTAFEDPHCLKMVLDWRDRHAHAH